MKNKKFLLYPLVLFLILFAFDKIFLLDKVKSYVKSDFTYIYYETREALFEIVEKYGYEIIEINLEADYEVLATRFDERVANALVNKSKTISNTSKERFREIYDTYQSEKNSDAIVLRTDELNGEEVAQKIFQLIQ